MADIKIVDSRQNLFDIALIKAGSIEAIFDIGEASGDISITSLLETGQGSYKLKGNYLTITGIQLNDTLDLVYEKQTRLKPKQWFW